MLLRIITFLISILVLASCEKPDPHPELKDPIYNDIKATVESTTKALEAEKKTLEGHEKELREVVPQSGQIKYATKRVEESRAKIQKLEQEKAYLELKLEARRSISAASYAEAFKKKEPWPNPNDFKSYELEKRFRGAKRDWSIKDRMKELGGEQEKTHKAPAGGEE